MAAFEVMAGGVGVLFVGVTGLQGLLRYRYRKYTRQARQQRARYAISVAKRQERDFSADRLARGA